MGKIWPLLLLPTGTGRSRADDCKGGVIGPNSAFSLEPQEFKAMVEAIRTAEKVLGEVRYELEWRMAR